MWRWDRFLNKTPVSGMAAVPGLFSPPPGYTIAPPATQRKKGEKPSIFCHFNIVRWAVYGIIHLQFANFYQNEQQDTK
jgi:choline-glycine betaine transporter